MYHYLHDRVSQTTKHPPPISHQSPSAHHVTASSEVKKLPLRFRAVMCEAAARHTGRVQTTSMDAAKASVGAGPLQKNRTTATRGKTMVVTMTNNAIVTGEGWVVAVGTQKPRQPYVVLCR